MQCTTQCTAQRTTQRTTQCTMQCTLCLDKCAHERRGASCSYPCPCMRAHARTERQLDALAGVPAEQRAPLIIWKSASSTLGSRPYGTTATASAPTGCATMAWQSESAWLAATWPKT